ncbi:Histidine Kinase [Planktothrix tepida]|uniref:histidine kinase n=1 Tax=Planktothrix pseudagardhii TaxID=132604 RepID=A0A9W4G806_9CYAN|nr:MULTISPECIES: HAMP domain-containing sensor histidine kinase [Planktothrix]CAD5940445.1 Histidine Kinase [Planktothrix tepida]CAD5971045.1 Histidine Kinase [Planktothrix pseudagardhii]
MMNEILLPTLSDILAEDETHDLSSLYSAKLLDQAENNFQDSSTFKPYSKAEKEWYSGVQSINFLLEEIRLKANAESTNTISSCPSIKSEPLSSLGLIISGPVPVLIHPYLAIHFATQIFTHDLSKLGDELVLKLRHPLALLPASDGTSTSLPETLACPLHGKDPLVKEQFCLVLTRQFSLIMVLGQDAKGNPAFLFSFNPDIVEKALLMLRDRMDLIQGTANRELRMEIARQKAKLEENIAQFLPIEPSYQTVMKFSRLLLNNLCLEINKKAEVNPLNNNLKTVTITVPKLAKVAEKISPKPSSQFPETPILDNTIQTAEVELLQAIAHEVRTPLATIRTLTRLLLKRPDLPPEVIRKRLEMIDQECTTQIDRFNLIFRAVELEIEQARQNSRGHRDEKPLPLTAMSLAEVFQISLPRWQKQASQRNQTLEVILPQKLPTVVSDPTMLDQVLTGVIENFTRSLPDGSHIQVGVRLAGHQLKLQLESQPQPGNEGNSSFAVSPQSPLKSIGPLLMFQPETGCLSLNMAVTKNLFQALGGKLVVKQRPQQGNVMTIYLPLWETYNNP